jgi:hypothetical protein
MQAPDEIAVFAARLDALGVEHMITGATAAILYGQPRLTNDIDVVLALRDDQVLGLISAFPDTEFYVPPESVIRVERARSLRGHFNILHYASGYKADLYLAGSDPLHVWALPLRRRIPWSNNLALQVAPPEYVIVRKLEYFREGGSTKHAADIRAMLAVTSVDLRTVEHWVERLGLATQWAAVRQLPGN